MICFQCLLWWSTELLIVFDDSQPERCQLIIVIASAMAMAFDHWLWSEFLQTWSRRNQILTKASAIIRCWLIRNKRVSQLIFGFAQFNSFGSFDYIPSNTSIQPTILPNRVGSRAVASIDCERQWCLYGSRTRNTLKCSFECLWLEWDSSSVTLVLRLTTTNCHRYFQRSYKHCWYHRTCTAW